VLDAFPASRFILVGDTGEQDMELYAELASERPNQIVAVFVRDVTTGSGEDPLKSARAQTQAIGSAISNRQFGGLLVDREPESLTTVPSWDSLGSSRSSSATSVSNNETPRPPPGPARIASSQSSARFPTTPTTSTPRFPGFLPRRKSSAGMTVEERRLYELQTRIERAREAIPRQIAFRVFKEPEECTEVKEILDRFCLGEA